ncbi:MAG: hypothetical protein HY722_03790 [Planctomycetes bacterium]|nr:hypothetical protein [Planctomycetota bacterium]
MSSPRVTRRRTGGQTNLGAVLGIFVFALVAVAVYKIPAVLTAPPTFPDTAVMEGSVRYVEAPVSW